MTNSRAAGARKEPGLNAKDSVAALQQSPAAAVSRTTPTGHPTG